MSPDGSRNMCLPRVHRPTPAVSRLSTCLRSRPRRRPSHRGDRAGSLLARRIVRLDVSHLDPDTPLPQPSAGLVERHGPLWRVLHRPGC